MCVTKGKLVPEGLVKLALSQPCFDKLLLNIRQDGQAQLVCVAKPGLDGTSEAKQQLTLGNADSGKASHLQ